MLPTSAKQPKALSFFFFTEMWERYGFYAIQALLVFYLIHVFHLSDKISYGILGSITALSYGNSVLGGYIADRFLGHRTAVLLATIMLSIGYSLAASSYNLAIAFIAFSIVTVGTGLLKPNINTMVGFLYEENDVRRHSGYTLFYVGVNMGIILGETVAGLIQQYFGWHSMFFSASFVLLIAFVIFWLGTRRFNITDLPRTEHPIKMPEAACLYSAESLSRASTRDSSAKSIANYFIATTLIIASTFMSYYVISHPQIATIFFTITAIACAIIICYEAYYETGSSRKKLLAFLILVGISTCYWALYFQMFFSMNLFIERAVDRHILGFTLIPSIYPAIQAGGVIIFGLFLGWGWRWLETFHPRFNPSIPMKFTFALLFHTIALGIFYINSLFTDSNMMIMPQWLIITYLFISLGELLLSPVGLSMVGELVPKRLNGLMMGIFFISLGLGGKLAGTLANISAIPEEILNDLSAVEHIYQHSFLIFALFSLGATVISFCLVPLIKRLINPKNTALTKPQFLFRAD